MIENNAWLVPLIIGLNLDIAGVIILLGPLLKFNHNRYKILLERLEESQKEFYKKNEIFLGVDPDPPKIIKDISFTRPEYIDKEFARLDSNITSVLVIDSSTKLMQRNDAIFGLVVITCGFILQMIGNAMNVN